MFHDENAKLEVKEQRSYRSGFGMMLYLVKHLRPDLANPVCELSKVMDGASNYHLKELYRIISHTLNNETLGLKLFQSISNASGTLFYSENQLENNKKCGKEC